MREKAIVVYYMAQYYFMVIMKLTMTVYYQNQNISIIGRWCWWVNKEHGVCGMGRGVQMKVKEADFPEWGVNRYRLKLKNQGETMQTYVEIWK